MHTSIKIIVKDAMNSELILIALRKAIQLKISIKDLFLSYLRSVRKFITKKIKTHPIENLQKKKSKF